jgi:hypothetical protein
MTTSVDVEIVVADDRLTSYEEEGYTYLHCTFYTSPKYTSGWWVNIFKTSYIVNSLENERLELLQAINIPYAPERHYLKKLGDSLNFTIIFPKTPIHWEYFDFIEKCGGDSGLKIKNIKSNSSGVYKVVIS